MSMSTGSQLRGNATGITGGDIIPKGYRSGQMQRFTPEQTQLFQQMFSQVSPDSYLSKLAGGDEGAFEQMEAPAMRQFQGLQGQLASRFSGQGMGGRRSSGFQNEASQASSDFAQDLASKRQALQMGALQQLQSMSHSLLNEQPYERSLIKKQEPWWKQLISGANEAGKAFAGKAGEAAGFAMFA